MTIVGTLTANRKGLPGRDIVLVYNLPPKKYLPPPEK
jgi:hypothetical protein